MALINCPECRKEISDKVKACPHCGYPFEEKLQESQKAESVEAISKIKHKSEKQKNKLGKKGKRKSIIFICIGIVFLLLIAGLTYFLVTANSRMYEKAVNEYNTGNYDDAIAVFNTIVDYSDSQEMIQKSYYEKAMDLYNNENYVDAQNVFSNCMDYSDSQEKIIECKYYIGKLYYDNREWQNAIDTLDSIDYQDSQELAEESKKYLELNGKADLDFLKDLVKGLNLRWEANEKDTSKMTSTEFKAYYIEFVGYETDLLYSYEDKEFSDQKLNTLALDYIDGLKLQEEALTYMNVDDEKFGEIWGKGYNERTLALVEIDKLYNLEFENEQIMEDFKTKAELILENIALDEEIKKIADNVNFELVEKSYGWKTYEAIVENTTAKDFEYFSFDINLLDENGVIIENEYASMDNWGSGQKAVFEFMTDANFETMEITATYNLKE